MADTKHKNIRGVVLFAALISCAVAFINKYPLVYSDTGAYIGSGFRGTVPDDRSLFYGLFIRHISLASSLWYVIIAQALLICWTLRLTLGIFFEGVKRDYVFLASIAMLTIGTGFSYTVSILLPDIFTALTILCLINLLINQKLSKLQFISVSILFMFSISTQFSSIAVITGVFGIIGIYVAAQLLKKKHIILEVKRVGIAFSLFVATLLLIPSVNYLFGGHFKISGGSHVFLMNHMVETGILQEYLDETCPEKDYKICQYKDNLSWNFIWADDSPLKLTGGWEANKTEYNAILKDIATTPKYSVLLSQKAAEYTFKQLFSFDAVVPSPLLAHSAPFGQINWRYTHSLREYISSLQNASQLKPDITNSIQFAVVILSVIVIFITIRSRELSGKISSPVKAAIGIFALHNLFNALVCSNFSTIDPRFQSRLIWLVPFFALIIMFKYIEQKGKEQKNAG